MRPPEDGPGEAAALRAFESANDRAATPAERKLLRDLAARFEPVAAAAHQERDDVPGSGWGWLEAAVWEAVEAGSAFVAPRRVREILLRWEREGFPSRAIRDRRGRSHRATCPSIRRRETTSLRRGRWRRSLPSRRSGSPTGRSGRRSWPSWRGGATSAGPMLETWLRPAALIGRDGETLLVGAPNAVARDRIATRLMPALRQAIAATIGVAGGDRGGGGGRDGDGARRQDGQTASG